MSKYRKKSVVIDAVQWDGANRDEVDAFFGVIEPGQHGFLVPNESIYIQTLEGNMVCSVGDWVIKGVNGEFYPCKPDIFEKTYEAVDDDPN